MGAAILGIGLKAAEEAGRTMLGIGLGKYQDRRQLAQQEKLQALQLKGNKEMIDYQMLKELEMWDKTNYYAQVEQLKKAGLNPALLYGMKGGGGITTGGSAAGVAGAQAPAGGGEIQSIIGMGIQTRLMKAQERVLQTQADKNEAEANKTKGVDTDLGKTQIQDLTQGIQNKKAQEIFTKVQTRLTELEATLKDRSLEDSVRIIGYESERMNELSDQAKFETNVAEATVNTKIATARAELLSIWLKNALTKAQTNVAEAQQADIIRQGVQRWQKLEIDMINASTNAKRQAQDEWVNDMQKSTGIPVQILEEVIEGLLRKPGVRRTEKSGYDRRRGDYYESTKEY